MAGERIERLQAAGRALVGHLDLANNPSTLIGVVEYHGIAQAVCDLTNDEGRAVACINQVGGRGSGARQDPGIIEGLKLLAKGRAGDRDQIRSVMILIADDANSSGRPPALQAAGMAAAQGVRLFTVSLGPDADRACLQQMATSPSTYFEARRAEQLIATFDRIAAEIAQVSISRLEITDLIPENMLYLASGSDATWIPSLRRLSWTSTFVGREGVTHTFQVRPEQAGRWPTNVEARAEFSDFASATGSFDFEVPHVSVHDPAVIGTSTPGVTPATTPGGTPATTPGGTPATTPVRSPSPTTKRVLLPTELVSRRGP